MTDHRFIQLHNTPDHWFVPGDAGQSVTFEDTEYRVVAVTTLESTHCILTYGLRLIPAVVSLELERADVPVVVQ